MFGIQTAQMSNLWQHKQHFYPLSLVTVTSLINKQYQSNLNTYNMFVIVYIFKLRTKYENLNNTLTT